MPSKSELKKYKRALVLQQDQTDCGVACLLSLVNFYGGTGSLEKLRELSGTDTVGTTLLGLYQCAQKTGFDADAYETDLQQLKLIEKPCILHVVNEGNLQHYIICFSYTRSHLEELEGTFTIGDPAKGIITLSENELEKIWQSKTLLTLSPNQSFTLNEQETKAKWQWFKALIKPDLNILALTMLLGIIATILGLAIAIFSQKLIDQIIPSGNTTRLITSLIVLFFVLLMRTGISYIRTHFLLLQSKDFNNRIVGNFFNALVYLPKSFFDTRKTGDMITRMQDTSRIQRNIAFITGSFFIDIIILLSTSFFLITYSKTIAIITFCFIPAIVLLILSYSKPIKKHQQEVMAYSGINQSNYIDTFNGISVIKQHLLETTFTQKIKNVYGSLQEKTLAMGKMGNRFTVMNDILGIILNIVLIATASFMVLNKQLKVGEMMAVISLSGSLIPAVARLSQINLQLQEAKVAFDRMYDFSSIQPEFVEEKITLIEFAQLEVKNISFRFAGRKPILKDVSVNLKKGEMIALLGESGCGKSTTLAILEKCYEIENGEITVNGTLLNHLYTPSWRNILAVVPQEIKLFNGSVIENIALCLNPLAEMSKVVRFCRDLGIEPFIMQLPQGYFTIIGEEGINLSGGQKQVIAICRALYKNPQILLLDEATSAMDRNTEHFILNLIKKEQLKGLSVLMVTHKASAAKLADRIYVIENGVTNVQGTPKELAATNNFFSQLIMDTNI
ncbi:peptidase domain-containing ABC transporter [Pedobacter sp. SL55]|uniref:peptidase domain-containing ABC transporter n=1 Tax=Pedobacter sp. SL55 TaxID=2995161 RepID=UPI002270D033|nr:peptidase domain-containing ABC transporter [Pedobacter sp. SL55]WAC42102.1 peptidase domain-containing ABC transporter [Pedobacter sp. SL55]